MEDILVRLEEAVETGADPKLLREASATIRRLREKLGDRKPLEYIHEQYDREFLKLMKENEELRDRLRSSVDW